MIEELKPGRELDALVAEKVMGIEVGIYSKFPVDDSREYRCRFSGQGSVFDLPHYSTDIAAAWEVVEKTKGCLMWCHGDKKWKYSFWVCGALDMNFEATCDTAPHAICLASLKATTHGGPLGPFKAKGHDIQTQPKEKSNE